MNKCRSNVRRDGLTPGQERAMQTLLTARSIAAAARQANVGQSTLRRWLREDDNFQEKLRQFRDQALSHAALLLQQGAATAVCIMYQLIESGKPIDPGRVSLIRTAIEFAFRAAVYCDILDRVKALEKAQRQSQPPADDPRPAPAPTEPRNGAARVSKRLPLVRDQPVLGDKRFAKPPAAKREFSQTCSNLPKSRRLLQSPDRKGGVQTAPKRGIQWRSLVRDRVSSRLCRVSPFSGLVFRILPVPRAKKGYSHRFSPAEPLYFQPQRRTKIRGCTLFLGCSSFAADAALSLAPRFRPSLL